MHRIGISAFGILILLVSTASVTNGLQVTPVNLYDDIKKSTKLIRENNRSVERISDFASECTSLITSGDISKISTCDSVLKKFNIDIGKFFSENKIVIEEMIYPYSIPSNATSVVGLDSASAIGASDPGEAREDAFLVADYLKELSSFSTECADRGRSYELDALRSCMDAMNSLNEHFRSFNGNTMTEFDEILGSVPHSESSLTSSSDT